MSALRRAGVWLGLVEEEDETVDDSFDDEFGDEDDFVPPRPRALPRPTARSDRSERPDRADRAEREIGRLERERERLERLEPQADRVPERRVDYDLRPPIREPREPTGRDRAPERGSVRPLTRQGGPAPTSGGVPTGTGSTGAYATVPTPRPYQETRSYQDTRSYQETRPHQETRSYQDTRPYQETRPYQDAPTPSTSFPTRDNLALAPQVQLRERAVVNDESARQHQITTLHLTSYSEARTIGEHFRDGYPVIMNLTEMDEPDAKRLVDFAAGLAFGMRGSMERVTNRVFLLSPPNIQVSAEDKARIAEGGFIDRT
jgi:FtsZ-interacting cell division protein YlmF